MGLTLRKVRIELQSEAGEANLHAVPCCDQIRQGGGIQAKQRAFNPWHPYLVHRPVNLQL